MDVVDELRQAHSRLAQCPDPIAGACVRCRAADEITRLRIERAARTLERRPGFFIPVNPQALVGYLCSAADFEMHIELAKAALEHEMREHRKEWSREFLES